MQITKRLRAIAFAAGFLGFAICANADITGLEWMVPDNFGSNCAQNASIGCVPTSNLNASFTLTGNTINLTSASPGSYTLGGFINSGGNATGISYLNGASATTSMDATSGSFGNCTGTSSHACGTIFEFTGTAFITHGEVFTTNSDDGVSLYIGCNNVATCTGVTPLLSAPGPEGASTHTSDPFAGATGNYEFDFVYAECCGAPASFTTTLPSGGNVPEPASIAMFGTTLVGIGFQLRRKLKA